MEKNRNLLIPLFFQVSSLSVFSCALIQRFFPPHFKDKKINNIFRLKTSDPEQKAPLCPVTRRSAAATRGRHSITDTPTGSLRAVTPGGSSERTGGSFSSGALNWGGHTTWDWWGGSHREDLSSTTCWMIRHSSWDQGRKLEKLLDQMKELKLSGENNRERRIWLFVVLYLLFVHLKEWDLKHLPLLFNPPLSIFKTEIKKSLREI